MSVLLLRPKKMEPYYSGTFALIPLFPSRGGAWRWREHRARQTGRHSKTEEQLFTFRDGYNDIGGQRFWWCQKSLDQG